MVIFPTEAMLLHFRSMFPLFGRRMDLHSFCSVTREQDEQMILYTSIEHNPTPRQSHVTWRGHAISATVEYMIVSYVSIQRV